MHLAHRLGVLISGIGILAIIFVIIAAAQRSPVFGKAAPTPTMTPTATPKPTLTPTPMPPPTATPRPTATPHPAHAWTLSGSAQITTDKATHLRMLVLRATLGKPARSHASISIPVHLDIRIENTGKHSTSYSAKSFYAVSSNGTTSRAMPDSHGSPPAGTLKPGKVVTLGLSFAVHAPGRYQLIWNDNNRLIPPARLGHYTVSKTG